jgi:hypothetical protein
MHEKIITRITAKGIPKCFLLLHNAPSTTQGLKKEMHEKIITRITAKGIPKCFLLLHKEAAERPKVCFMGNKYIW